MISKKFQQFTSKNQDCQPDTQQNQSQVAQQTVGDTKGTDVSLSQLYQSVSNNQAQGLIVKDIKDIRNESIINNRQQNKSLTSGEQKIINLHGKIMLNEHVLYQLQLMQDQKVNYMNSQIQLINNCLNTSTTEYLHIQRVFQQAHSSMKSQVETSNEKVKALETMAQELQLLLNNDDQNEQNSLIKKQIGEIKVQIETLNKQSTELEQKLVKIQANFATLEADFQQKLQDKVEKVLTHLDEEKQASQGQLEDNCQKDAEENGSLLRQAEGLKNEIDVIAAEIQQVVAQSSEQKEVIDDKQSQIQVINDRQIAQSSELKKLNIGISETTAQFQQQSQKQDAIQRKISELRQNNKQKHDKIVEIRQKIVLRNESLEIYKRKIETDFRGFQENITDLSAKIQNAEEFIGNTSEKTQQQAEQFDSQKASTYEISDRIENLKQILDSLDTQIDQLTIDVSRLEKNADSITGYSDDITAESEQRVEAQKRIKVQIGDLKEQKAEFDTKIQAQVKLFDNLKIDGNDLVCRLDELKRNKIELESFIDVFERTPETQNSVPVSTEKHFQITKDRFRGRTSTQDTKE